VVLFSEKQGQRETISLFGGGADATWSGGELGLGWWFTKREQKEVLNGAWDATGGRQGAGWIAGKKTRSEDRGRFFNLDKRRQGRERGNEQFGKEKRPEQRGGLKEKPAKPQRTGGKETSTGD